MWSNFQKLIGIAVAVSSNGHRNDERTEPAGRDHLPSSSSSPIHCSRLTLSTFPYSIPHTSQTRARARTMGEFHLHWGFNGEHVLVPFIVMKSFPSFILACLFVVAIYVTER